MQIAVCDDEPNVRILIKNMILTSEPSAEITEFDNGQELLLNVENKKHKMRSTLSSRLELRQKRY
jgi:DNA-binding NarL/FixJ family response regulator